MKKKDFSASINKGKEYKEALHRAAALCSRQEQCSGHIRDKLKEWHVSDEDAEEIIDYLKKEKFLDDYRYATHFVKDKFKFNQWGKIKISYMLRQKGVNPDAISKAVDQIDEEDYFKVCTDLILNKSASLIEKNSFTKKAKLFRFASGRGFESDLIHRILNMKENN